MPKPFASPMLLALMLGCPAPPATPQFELELLGTASVAGFDSLPEPEVTEVVGRRVTIHASFGLGATGYELVPSGTIGDGVVDMLVVARMPAEAMGLQVLTVYAYRLATPRLEPGTWTVRLHQVLDGEGDPEFLLEQQVVVPQ
jgi:hypothetical protein